MRERLCKLFFLRTLPKTIFIQSCAFLHFKRRSYSVFSGTVGYTILVGNEVKYRQYLYIVITSRFYRLALLSPAESVYIKAGTSSLSCIREKAPFAKRLLVSSILSLPHFRQTSRGNKGLSDYNIASRASE